jgi:PII-like signaling protein
MDIGLQPATKLTVFVGGDDRRRHRALYRSVTKLLRENGIAGAYLMKGVMSYGSRKQIHSTVNEITMENLPIIIEAIDEQKKIETVAPLIAELLGPHGLIQMQPTKVIRHAAHDQQRREV